MLQTHIQRPVLDTRGDSDTFSLFRVELLITRVSISKCSSHYWGSLLLFSFDAKNMPCMLRAPVLDPISPFSFDARVFPDRPLFD